MQLPTHAPPPRRPAHRRDDNCRYDPSQVRFPVCGSEQAQLGLTMAQQARGGEALQLAPCGLYPYLRGRTLWIMGWVCVCASGSVSLWV
jgi:hypothetical protein